MSPNPRPLADPSFISPTDDSDTLQVVIETPKGSRNKYAFDPQRGVIVLKKVLPAGMVFPYDFGFIPSTLADDGDPLDVLVFMDEPAFPGCVLDARPIGVIEGEDVLDDGTTQRNDRLLAVALAGHSFDHLQTPGDLSRELLTSMEEFFVSYPRILSGKTYRLVATKGPEEANKLIDQARRNASKPDSNKA